MTIQNTDRYLRNLWDWGCLDGCFGDSKVRPTDIDGFVERRGRFLVIETKEPTAKVSQGQEITFQALARTRLFTILIVWGHPGKPERIRFISARDERYYENANLDTLRRIVGRWYHFATNTPLTQPRMARR